MSHVDLHPALLAEDAHVWERDGARAVLAPKRISLGPKLSLGGLRLVGDALVGESDASADAFTGHLGELLRDGRADGILVEDLDTESALWRALTSGDHGLPLLQPRAPQPHWWIRFPDDPESYWTEKFSGKSRYKLRRKAKKFAHELTIVESPEQVVEFVEGAREVSENSWQGKRLGVRIREDDREHLAKLAGLGALRAYLLRHEGKPVAFVLGTQYDGAFSHEETGYDTAFAKSSPGEVLLLRLLEDLTSRNPPRTVDFGAGDAEYKQRYGTHETESGPIVVVAPRLRPQAVARAAGLAKAVDRSARTLLERTGLYDRVRRLYRR